MLRDISACYAMSLLPVLVAPKEIGVMTGRLDLAIRERPGSDPGQTPGGRTRLALGPPILGRGTVWACTRLPGGGRCRRWPDSRTRGRRG